MDFFRNTYRDTLRLVRGNDFATVNNIVAKYPDDTEVEGFDLNVCTDLGVRIRRNGSSFKDIETYAETWFILEPKKIRINFDGLKMKNGSYRIEFFGKFQGKDWRCYSEDKGFGIVESNEEANIPAETIIADGVYQILTDFTMTYQTQEQADWEETDDTLPSYIKNKPDVSNFVEKEEGKGLSENDYTDEDKQKVANAVVRTTSDLVNYYLRSETYTKGEVNQLISSISNFHYEIYQSISQITSPSESVLYLIGPIGSGSDRYEEYVYSDGAYEKIGDTSIDLSGYVTITALNEVLSDYVTSSSLADILEDYQEKLISGTNIKTINGQSILGEGNIEIQGGGGSGEENVIEVVKVNNVALTPDANKAVNVSVPTQLSQLNEDTTHRTVTDTEKATWDGKSDFSGSYDDLADKPTIPEEITVDSELNSTSTNPVQNKVVNSALGGKVDKVGGKGLSTNDYTNTEKSKLASLSNYDDTEVRSMINTKYTKPSSGIPASDIASGVIPDVSQFITKSVNDLANYYTKTQTYTQAEVNALIAAINQFHYEIAESTSAVVSPASNVLYLIGPTGTGADKYEEYVYTTTWVKIGDTSIDLSSYVTTTALNTALADYTTTTDLNTLLAGYQTKIDSNHKLDYSLLSNTPTIPDAQIQSDWEQTTTTAKDYIKNKPTIPSIAGLESTSNKVTSLSAQSTDTQYPSAKCVYDGLGAKQATIDSSHKLSADLVNDASSINKFVTASDKTTWSGKQDALVSGTNIKTINGNSVLGNGNLSTRLPLTSHGTSNTTYTLPANEYHTWGEVSALTITLGTASDNTVVNEYWFRFQSGSTATNLSISPSVDFPVDSDLIPEANRVYEVHIVGSYAVWNEWEVTS